MIHFGGRRIRNTNYDIAFRLVSDDNGRQDMGLRGMNENNDNDDGGGDTFFV